MDKARKILLKDFKRQILDIFTSEVFFIIIVLANLS